MSIFEITDEGALKLEPSGPTAYGSDERANLQRLLRLQVDIVAPDVLVVGEEVGGDGSARPIDLLGVDKRGSLVVIDLDRGEDRGELELQAVRHAALVSSMTFDEVTGIFEKHLVALGNDDSARELLLSFLQWDSPPESRFAREVRIVLAAAEFSRESTRSVLWLNDRGLDIRCVRLRPYTGGTRQFLDVQQIVPLPEAGPKPAPAPKAAKAGPAPAAPPPAAAPAATAEEPKPAPAPVDAAVGDLWFVNVGMEDSGQNAFDSNGRGNVQHWDNCVRYGYLASDGGAKHNDALRKLEPGAHIVAYQKGEGYVGYGIVTQPAEPIQKFRVEENRTLAQTLKQSDRTQNRTDDKSEYAVGISWRKTFPLANAKWFKGGFANQQVVCKLTDQETIGFLQQEFGIPMEEWSELTL